MRFKVVYKSKGKIKEKSFQIRDAASAFSSNLIHFNMYEKTDSNWKWLEGK